MDQEIEARHDEAFLLIVPVGIEILQAPLRLYTSRSFNRTSRN